MLPHHNRQPSENQNPEQHVEVLTRFRQLSAVYLSNFFNTHTIFQQLWAEAGPTVLRDLAAIAQIQPLLLSSKISLLT